jgi:DNA-binding response OmpR family regulator
MTGGLALDGKRVLVIEDDYYLATDQAATIKTAGGTVVACTANPDEAHALMEREQIDCALVDINLGNGPAFETAQALRDHHIPFIFTTGYDAAVVPNEFRNVVRLEKPFDHKKLLTTLVSIL